MRWITPDAQVCSVEWCDRIAKVRGWCSGHYDTFLKTGSPVRKCRSCKGEIRERRRLLCDACFGLRRRGKVCKRCRGPKEPEDWWFCKSCVAETATDLRTCKECGITRSVLHFRVNKGRTGKFYVATRCNVCQRSTLRDKSLKRLYGISLDDYDAMLVAQGGACAICGGKPKKETLHVDHNHKTGAVRGLLCSWCNFKVLGGSKESPRILRAAADYLERYA